MPGENQEWKNQRTIRLAVIGIGNIGTAHVGTIDALPDVELAAVCILTAPALMPARTYGRGRLLQAIRIVKVGCPGWDRGRYAALRARPDVRLTR